MARRPQTRQSSIRLYEDFYPASEWKEEPEDNILIVHLPDFKKEQIGIACVRSSRIVRVTGDRQLLDNKWSRCNAAFQIPQNCKIDKIQAKWQDGTLTITMPKETITQPVARNEEAKTTQEAPKDHQQPASPKVAAEPKSSKDYQQVAPGKAAATSINEKQNEVKKDASPKEPTSSIHGEKKTEGRSIDALSAQKSEKERQGESIFPESAYTMMKQRDQSSPVPKFENIDEMKRKERGTRIDNIAAESKKPEDVTEETTRVKKSAFPGTSEKKKEKEDKSAGEDKQKEKQDSIAVKTMKKKTIAVAPLKGVKGLGMEQNGDRQLVINISVAALVLAALGAYVSYSFGSKSKD